MILNDIALSLRAQKLARLTHTATGNKGLIQFLVSFLGISIFRSLYQ